MSIEYIYIGILGSGRALISLPFEHPLDYFKTQKQVNPMVPYSKLISNTPFRYMYRGFIPNAARQAIKQGYRFPLMIGLPNLYRRVTDNEMYVQSLTGCSIAAIESVIICPLERLKVWLMTSPQCSQLTQFFSQTGPQDLFRGLTPLMLRQITSWVSFLSSTHLFKEACKSITGRNDLTALDLLMVSVGVGVVNTAVIMPIDFVKTYTQKFQEINNNSLSGFKREIFSLLDAKKIRLLYAGYSIRLFHYIINAAFTVNLLDYLVKKYDNNS